MDLYCPKCGEPWDLDELHFVDGLTFDQAWTAFRRYGCAVFGEPCEPNGSMEALKSQAIYEVLGEDPDGCAAMLEDLWF